MSKITDTIAQLKSGKIEIDAAASAIADARVPQPGKKIAKSAEDLFRAEQQDIDSTIYPNTFDEVSSAHISGEITDDQYEAIANACAAKKA